jgi:hypothetical protein
MVAQQATDLTLKTAARSGQNWHFDENILLGQLAPILLPKLSTLLRDVPEFSGWLEAEASARTTEIAYACREVARDQGLRESREIIKALIEAIAEPDPAVRSMVIVKHAGAINRALANAER